MPLIAYVHAREGSGRPAWEPEPRVWRPAAGALLSAAAGTQLRGLAGVVLVVVAFGLACRAADAAIPPGDDLRAWRQ